MDWVLFSNSITQNLKSEKFKSRFFDMNFPIENSKLLKLIFATQKNNQKKFLHKLEILISEFNIPTKEKYSNDLIFDDYSQSSLILYDVKAKI